LPRQLASESGSRLSHCGVVSGIGLAKIRLGGIKRLTVRIGSSGQYTVYRKRRSHSVYNVLVGSRPREPGHDAGHVDFQGRQPRTSRGRDRLLIAPWRIGFRTSKPSHGRLRVGGLDESTGRAWGRPGLGRMSAGDVTSGWSLALVSGNSDCIADAHGRDWYRGPPSLLTTSSCIGGRAIALSTAS
jgi:hypothetical protein